MISRKSFRPWREPALAAVAIMALLLGVLIAFPGVRSRVAPQLDSAAAIFMFEDDTPRDKAQPSGEGNSFKRIVSAPVRFVARLFRGKPKNEDPQLAVRKASDKDLERLKVAAMTRVRNGVPGENAENSSAYLAEGNLAGVAAVNLFEEAVELHGKGRIDGAMEKLVAALVLRPNFAEAYNLLAVCYDEKGQYRNAQTEYKKAIKVERNNARFYNNLGYSYYLANDFGGAVKWYKKGLKLTPEDRRLHNNLGLAYGRKGDYARAKEHFVIAVGEVGANLNLGYVYSQQGRYEDAIRHYEIALRDQPQSLPALGNLAQLYERTGRLREAATLNDQYKKLAVSAQQREQTVDQ